VLGVAVFRVVVDCVEFGLLLASLALPQPVRVAARPTVIKAMNVRRS
jgi:hypothetical protein